MIRKSIYNYLAPFVLIVLFIFSCKHEVPQPLNGEDDGGDDPTDTIIIPEPEAAPCDSDTVYFENTILPIFVSNCAKSGCHNTVDHQDGIILNNYANIMSTGDIEPFDTDAGDIVEMITESDPDDRMPPPGNAPLTSQQINWIITWINQGALNNSCNSCDTSQVTFAATVFPIISAKCKGCHQGAAPGGGITFLNYADVALRANNGQLMGAITHAPGYSPMPKLAGKLPACDIAKIGIWVNDGAPNN